MQAEIITIGDELLTGQTVDTNTAWLGKELNAVGVDLTQTRSIRDTPEAVIRALDALLPGTELVLLTGGLGPTNDDITKTTLCSYFGGKLVFRPEIYAHIENLFRRLGRTPGPMNRDQANLPDVCDPLHNPVGTASGMRFQRDGVYYISMPGVPQEMKALMTKHVLPWITETWPAEAIVHHTLLTVGVPESEIATRLQDWEQNLPEPLSLAYLPSLAVVRLRLTARTGHAETNRRIMAEQVDQARELLGDMVYGENEDTLEEVVGRLLIRAGATLSTAESCTGAAIASRITRIAGSSAYYLGSVVSYSNEVKKSLLGVNETDLTVHGAVSEPVVRQMARGVSERLSTTYAISTSGIAGPDGGTDEKPVGTVWIAVHEPGGTTCQRFVFGRRREQNIELSVIKALDMLRRALLADSRVMGAREVRNEKK